MPKLPSTSEVIHLEREHARVSNTIIRHTPEFKECLQKKYHECNERFPAMRLMVRREFAGDESISIEVINETYKLLNDCKSEAYKWCREAFTW